MIILLCILLLPVAKQRHGRVSATITITVPPRQKGGRKENDMAKLTIRNMLTKEAYKALTPAERRHMLKIEQAKEYSGWAKYPSTCGAIMEHLPDDIWERYTAKQIGEIMQIAHTAYIAGKKEKAAEAAVSE